MNQRNKGKYQERGREGLTTWGLGGAADYSLGSGVVGRKREVESSDAGATERTKSSRAGQGVPDNR